METTVQTLVILIILLALAANLIVTQFVRRRRRGFALRAIAPYDGLPLLTGAAVEANRPLHLSPGSAGLDGVNTLLALASAELLYQASRRAAISPAAPIITLGDASALPLGYDTLRRAYQARDMLDRHPGGAVRWYPGGPRSLAYAAALTATLADDDVGVNLLAGSFGPEVALIGGAAARLGQPFIAASDQLEGQAVGYAFSDPPLIGEEIFFAGAYLEGRPGQVGAAITQDVLRWTLIAVLIVAALVAGLGGG